MKISTMFATYGILAVLACIGGFMSILILIQCYDSQITIKRETSRNCKQIFQMQNWSKLWLLLWSFVSDHFFSKDLNKISAESVSWK